VAGAAGSLGKRLVATVGCLSCPGFLVTCKAQFILPGDKQFAVIGSVSFVACKTSAIIRYRIVRGFQRHVFIRMTVKTQGVARPGKQHWTFGGMGIVTGITLAVLKRRVLNMTTGFQLGRFVAFQAEVAALWGDIKWFLRFGGVMAFCAIRFGHRFVGTCFQEFGLN